MEDVAHHLQTEALRRHRGDIAADAFGRSAYNRYYYATYLIVRELMGKLKPEWQPLPHADIPDTLAKSVANTINAKVKVANKASDYELVAKLKRGVHAAKNLSQIMKTAYGMRVVADYKPDITIEFQNSDRFSLNNMEITEAHNWPQQARNLSAIVEAGWREANA